MANAGPVTLVSAMCLSACVGQPAVQAGPVSGFADGTVVVRDRAFVATFVLGTVGTVLTADGAKPVSGAAVGVYGADLRRDEGIIAKEAAMQACTAQGRAFQPQAIGRYAGPGQWMFDGACA